nr:hypothetical protein [Tanacetum cinerariifolium]
VSRRSEADPITPAGYWSLYGNDL